MTPADAAPDAKPHREKPDDTPASMRMKIAVATVRILSGAVFAFAGFAKIVDPWGAMLKVGEYLGAMGIPATRPEALVLGCVLATAEFVVGLLLLTGCLRRFTAWAFAAFMAVMTPLTLWLWIAEPVADCGCFGEALALSNGATFWKNVVLAAGAVFLVKYNTRLRPFVRPAIQWLVPVAGVGYAVVVATVGYNAQPLVDFRPFSVGEPLVKPDDSMPAYIYAKGGDERQFSADNLPDDSWTFVRVEEPATRAASLVAFNSDGDEVMDSLIEMSRLPGGLLILSVPDPRFHGLSRLRMANRLARYQSKHRGAMAALVATENTAGWVSSVNARYPVYSAEDTDLEMLARGDASLVFVHNDTVRWKYNLYALDPSFPDSQPSGNLISKREAIENSSILLWLTLILVSILVVLAAVSCIPLQRKKC